MTTIVIAVSRSAVEDIRRVEDRVVPKFRGQVDQFKAEIDRMTFRERIDELKLELAINLVRLITVNHEKIEVHRSNLEDSGHIQNGMAQELRGYIVCRRKLHSVFLPVRLDGANLDGIVKKLNKTMKGLVGDDVDDECAFLDLIRRYLLVRAEYLEKWPPKDAIDGEQPEAYRRLASTTAELHRTLRPV